MQLKRRTLGSTRTMTPVLRLATLALAAASLVSCDVVLLDCHRRRLMTGYRISAFEDGDYYLMTGASSVGNGYVIRLAWIDSTMTAETEGGWVLARIGHMTFVSERDSAAVARVVPEPDRVGLLPPDSAYNLLQPRAHWWRRGAA